MQGRRWTTIVSRDGEGARLELWAQEHPDDADNVRLIASARTADGNTGIPFDDVATESHAWVDQADVLYRTFADLGVRFGPEFRTLARWRVGSGAAEGWLTRASDAPAGPGNGVHPALLDGALQLCVLAASSAAPDALLLPIAVESYTLHRLSPSTLRAEVRITERSAGGSIAAAVRLFSETGSLVASLDGVRFAPAGAAAVPDVGPVQRSLAPIAVASESCRGHIRARRLDRAHGWKRDGDEAGDRAHRRRRAMSYSAGRWRG